jgi:hypothetical protein
LHGMAYYIFLKSLRSLEEFRKNPHVKIPPKSPCANYQRLGKFKNPIFNSEILFLAFIPADLAAHSAFGPASPLALLPLQAETALAGPPSPRVGHVFTGIRFPFWFAPSELAASPLVSLPSGAELSVSSSSCTGQPLPLSPVASGHPAPPDLRPRDARRGIHSTP